MKPRNLLIAGSTGHLGQALVSVGLEQGHEIRAVARRPEALAEFQPHDHLQVVRAELTQPDQLRGICDGVDVVISALGITRQRGPETFHEVDYRANLYLLSEASHSGVQQFIYTSGYGVDEGLDNALYRAKKDFELALMVSGVPYVIMRPTGFFSDMFMIFDMARQGRVFLLGPGTGKINPIHLLDLAEFYYLHLDDPNRILEVGGPTTFTFQEIVELAFQALGKKPRVTHVPVLLVKALLPLIKPFSEKTYTELKAFTHIMVEGAEAPRFGRRGLAEAYREAAKDMAES